ncbi:hypothetical protein GCM10011418_47090 [Sphingobacterium alkalisoli]|nr:hypothetical protein [Sphingobacterium alkalisoli]GGH33106.1 hypothetical protein GCM10011418_47090 [Sphingobacterium alkalisoli]
MSQDIPNGMLEFAPSPTAAEMEKYISTPVGLFTGSIEQNIPLYELKTKNLSVPISVRYSSNGLIVNKASSNIGHDWNLSYGATLVRQVRGYPDDANRFSREAFPIDLKDFRRNTVVSSSDRTRIFDFFATWHQEVDTEPDMFSFSVGKYSGQFYVDNNHQVVLVPYQKIKIEQPLKYNTFSITTPDGVKYEFTSGEFSGEGLTSSITSYSLSRIIHPQGDEIKFYYKFSAAYQIKTAITDNRSYVIATSSNAQTPCPYDLGVKQFAELKKTRIMTLVIDSIVAKGYGKVVFDSDNNRLDLPERKINGLSVYDYRGELLRSVDFFQHSQYSSGFSNSVALDQMNNNTSKDDVRYRLFLDSMFIKDNVANNVQRYSFTYNDITELPIRLSYAQDHWGYFNGAFNSSLLPDRVPPVIKSTYFPAEHTNADRNPNASYSKKGVLKRIEYPTGGYTVFEYESHTNEIGAAIGGIRVSKQIDYLSLGSSAVTKTYKYFEGRTNVYSTLTGEYFVAFNFSSECINIGEDPFNDDGVPMPYTTQYTVYWLRSNWINPTSISSVYNCGYQRVQIHNNEPNNGWEEHGFTVEFDTDESETIYGTYTMLPNGKTNGGWKSGQKKFVKYFSKESKLVESIEYGYTDHPAYEKTKYYPVIQLISLPQPGIVWGYDKLNNYFNMGKYAIISKWNYLSSEKRTVYDKDGFNPVISQVNYYYDNVVHAQLSRQTEQMSRGVLSETQYLYPQDYSIGSANFSDLTNKYILNKPIDVRTLRNGTGVSAQQFRYNNLGQLEDMLAADIAQGEALPPINPSIPYTLPISMILRYDITANTISYSKEREGPVVSYLWSHNNISLLAKVVNASYNDIAYAGFEGTEKGNWIYSGPAYNLMPYTGNGSYILRSNTPLSKSGLNSSKTYIVTMCVKGQAIPTFTGGVQVSISSVPSADDWYECRYVFRNATSITIGSSLTSGTLIDDVRLYPVDAQMTTYTYDPLIGMTSMTDPRGITEYYKYDGFQRLKDVLDFESNVLKNYQYHYKPGTN